LFSLDRGRRRSIVVPAGVVCRRCCVTAAVGIQLAGVRQEIDLMVRCLSFPPLFLLVSAVSNFWPVDDFGWETARVILAGLAILNFVYFLFLNS
jgi:hypothetical protein